MDLYLYLTIYCYIRSLVRYINIQLLSMVSSSNTQGFHLPVYFRLFLDSLWYLIKLKYYVNSCKCDVNTMYIVASQPAENSSFAFWNLLEIFFSWTFSICCWLNLQMQNFWVWRADYTSYIGEPVVTLVILRSLFSALQMFTCICLIQI